MFYISKDRLMAIIISMFLILMLFQSNLAHISSISNETDEIFTVLIFIIYLFKILKEHSISMDAFCIFLGLFIIIVIGILGNKLSQVNFIFSAICIDIISVVKVPTIFLATIGLINYNITKEVLSNIGLVLRLFVHLAFIGLPIGYILHISFFFNGVRYGLKSYNFISDNPGIFGYYIMGILAFCTLDSVFINSFKGHLFIFESCFLLLMTTKGPQILFVIILLLTQILTRKSKKIKFWHLLALLFPILFVGSYQLKKYLLNSTSARYALNQTGFKIGRNYFPIGTGFGTFGSDVSRKYYSQIYYDYGIANLWGIGQEDSYDNGSFITDNYWPMLVGQFGFIGLTIMACIYLYFYKVLNNVYDKILIRKNIFLAMYIAFMLGSLGSQYLTSVNGVFCFLILGIYIGNFKNCEYGTIVK